MHVHAHVIHLGVHTTGDVYACVCEQVVYGRWLIDGYPKVVLFDISTAMRKVDDWKQEIWTTSHIGIPWIDQEATDAVAFGYMTAIFLAEVLQALPALSSSVHNQAVGWQDIARNVLAYNKGSYEQIM